MDNREYEKILASAERLRLREKEPEPWSDNYSDMNSMEKSMLLDELFALRKADREDRDKLLEKLDRMTEQLLVLNENSQRLLKQNDELKQMLSDRDALIEKLQKENAALKEQKKLDRKNLYGSKSQKASARKRETSSREEDKDDFDGRYTPQDCSASDMSNPEQPEKKEEGPYRKGMSYRRMKADRYVCHESDLSKLPHDAVVIKTFYKYAYEQVSIILEHRYQVVRYKTGDGKIREEYIPKENGPERIDVVPGTHASGDFLAHLAFNHFVLNIPYYREMYRINDHSMSLSRMTLVNWLDKGAAFTAKLVEALKAMATEKDSIVNCDETWCKVRVRDAYKKKYIWCLVNKEQRTAIFFYENGSRGRDVLTDFLGDAELKSIMSDGYNAYVFIGDGLKSAQFKDTVHQVCMSHAKNKFVKAASQGHEAEAELFAADIGELFANERRYARAGLAAEERLRERQSTATKEIVIRMRGRLESELARDTQFRSQYYREALNYLKKFWKELFAFLHDGDFPIDNNLAERTIRKLTTQRNSSLHYGSDAGAEMAVTYHSIISTVKLHGCSTWNFIGTFFKKIFNGCRDYASMVPDKITLAASQC